MGEKIFSIYPFFSDDCPSFFPSANSSEIHATHPKKGKICTYIIDIEKGQIIDMLNQKKRFSVFLTFEKKQVIKQRDILTSAVKIYHYQTHFPDLFYGPHFFSFEQDG